MKRRNHGPLRPVYVRADQDLSDMLDEVRRHMGDSEGAFVSRGEAARRLLDAAVRQYLATSKPKRKTPRG